jgi:ribosome-associated protein
VQSIELAEIVEGVLDDMKAADIVALNVDRLTSITDYMLIASGRSNRHVRSIADSVVEKAREAGCTILGVEGHDYGEWVLVDLGDVIVHIMQPKTRDFYKLENLWSMGDTTRNLVDAEQVG